MVARSRVRSTAHEAALSFNDTVNIRSRRISVDSCRAGLVTHTRADTEDSVKARASLAASWSGSGELLSKETHKGEYNAKVIFVQRENSQHCWRVGNPLFTLVVEVALFPPTTHR